MRTAQLSVTALETIRGGAVYMTERWAYAQGRYSSLVYRIPTEQYLKDGARFRFEGSEIVSVNCRPEAQGRFKGL